MKKKLLRAAAVCVLAVTALTPVNAATLGQCVIRCSPLFPFTAITTYTTAAECCGGDVGQYCPSGTGYAISWNSSRCGV